MAAKDIEAGRAHVLIAIRDRLSQGLKTAEAKLRAFGSTVAMSAAAVSAGITAAIAWPIKLASNMEQTKTSFAVFLGSMDLAEKKLKEIEAMGAATPFTFDDLKDGAQTLLNFSVSADALLPSLRNLGDVSGGNAERFQRLSLAFGQVMGKGRLMGQEVNQMIEAGFNPLQEISRTTGISMAKLSQKMEDGQISSRALAMAFASAAGPGGRFSGMMDKQSQTLTGLYSTLSDNVAMAARAFGDALLPMLKESARRWIMVSTLIRDFMTRNQYLVSIAAKVTLVMLKITTAVTALGTALFAAGVAIGFISSPLGIAVGLLMAAAGVAIYFRKEIMAALSGVIAYFQPLIDSVMQLYGIFMKTFGGIVAALQSGSLEQAATIAWAGFSAMAWTAIADMMGAFSSLLGFLESYLPGISEMFNVMFAGIGNAILAGRWDLAGALAMAKLYLAMVQGMNAIAFAWDMLVTGFQTVFDTIFTGVKSAFWATIYGFAKGIAWLSAQISSLLGLQDPLQGAAEGLQQMEREQATADQKAAFMRDQGRMKRNQENADARGKAEQAAGGKVAGLEIASAAAATSAGAPTVKDVAGQAWQSLDDALAKAKEEQKAKAKKGEEAAKGPEALAGSTKPSGKGGAASGTFSALASMLGNRTNANAAESTAKNTAQLVRIAKQQLAKPEPGLG